MMALRSRQPGKSTWEQSSWIHRIVTVLFEPTNRRLTNWRDSLIEENNKLLIHNGGLFPTGFQYKGETFNHSNAQGLSKLAILQPSMWRTVEQYIRDKQQVDDDIRRISQVLSMFISPEMTGQELRDRLPDCLGFTFTKSKERTYPQNLEKFLSEQQIQDYKQVLPLIEKYAATRLFF